MSLAVIKGGFLPCQNIYLGWPFMKSKLILQIIWAKEVVYTS